jgi:putative MATE family efflux protein
MSNLGEERGTRGDEQADRGALSARARAAGWWERLRNRDHTRGSLFASLGALALPLIGSSLVGGVAFQLTDLKLVSGLGEDATAAVVITNHSWRQVLFMLVMGASFGAQGLISRCIGRGDREAADHVAGQVVALGAMLSLAVGIAGVVYARQMLAAMNVSPEVLGIGTPYVRLVFSLNWCFVFLFLANAILNGAGDNLTPMLILMLQVPVALGAEWCLIYGRLGLPPLGVRGVVLGLAAAQVISLAIYTRVFFGGTSRIHLRLSHLIPDPTVMRRILALSWPPAIMMLGNFLVTVFFIRLMGDFGSKAQAAYSIGLRLGMMGPILSFPVAGACATLVGQNLGSGNIPRAWRSLGVGLVSHVSLLWSAALVLFLFRVPLLETFADDAEVIRIGSELLVYQAGSFAMLGFYFVFFRALQGAGDVLVPMLLSLGTSLLVTLPLGIWLSAKPGYGPTGIFMASFVGAVVATLLTGFWIGTGRWTTARMRARDRAGR